MYVKAYVDYPKTLYRVSFLDLQCQRMKSKRDVGKFVLRLIAIIFYFKGQLYTHRILILSLTQYTNHFICKKTAPFLTVGGCFVTIP